MLADLVTTAMNTVVVWCYSIGRPGGGYGGKGGSVILSVGKRLSGFDQVYSDLKKLDRVKRREAESNYTRWSIERVLE